MMPKQMEVDNNTESGNDNDTSVDEPTEKQCKFNETIKKDDTKYADIKMYMKCKKDKIVSFVSVALDYGQRRDQSLQIWLPLQATMS